MRRTKMPNLLTEKVGSWEEITASTVSGLAWLHCIGKPGKLECGILSHPSRGVISVKSAA